MQTRRLASTIIALITALSLTVGCSNAKETRMTQDEAVALVDQRAQEAFHQLPPGATLKRGLHIPDFKCDNGGNSTFVETNYDVLFDEGWPLEQGMADLATYWAGNGYKVVRDDRRRSVPELFVEKKTDGFRVGYLINPNPGGKAVAGITSSSPCFRR